jgi:amino acid adenylation domain-containing protein
MIVGEIEDIYPLSPVQQGMLFHSLYMPTAGVYFQQVSCILDGDLDVAAFRQAWVHVQARHAMLRSAVVWEDLDEPVQVVLRQAALPLSQHDWRNIPAADQSQHLAAFMVADRARGLDLSAAPLMRLALIRLADARYQFVWSRQHLLLDGWSVALVLQEVFASYAALVGGQPTTLPTPRPYRDYISWLQQQDLTAAATFWRAALAGVGAPTALGIDHPGGGGASAQGYALRQQRLPAATTAGLQALARAEQLTLNTLLQGGWALLLQRYSGADDVVFGATVAGRPTTLAGVEGMVGLFINTLPVRVRLAASARLTPWLQALLAEQAAARHYEYAPLVQIQGWSDIPRGQPLFESLLVFENFPSTPGQPADGLSIGALQTLERTNYPLTIMIYPGDQLALGVWYECGRFDDVTITRMLGHVQTLLAGMIARPMARLAELPLLKAAEQRQMLVDWNATAATYPQAARLHQLIEAQAAQTPDAVALAYETNDERRRTNAVGSQYAVPLLSSVAQLSYAELDRRANQLAHELRTLGVGPEVRVGLCVERTPELLIALLGVHKAGGVYVPLDPAYPAERLAFMLADAQVAVLLTTSIDDVRFTSDDLAASQTPIVTRTSKIVHLQADWPRIAQRPTHPPSSGVAGDNLAYVIYTSGSTGRPKGVAITHDALVNELHAMRQAPGLTAQDILLAVSTIAFDIAGLELLLPLLCGARVELVPRAIAMDGRALAARLSRHRATIMQATPATWRMLIDAGWLGSAQLTILCGGEALPRDLADQLLDRCAALWNLYGPTETTIWSTVARIAAGADVPIGRPIANMQLYLLDRWLNPTPIGVAGELHIGGAGLARGYIGRPDLTAERFVPNPFGNCRLQIADCRLADATICNLQSAICNRLYKTGDLARYRADGSIDYLGRIDGQIKLRGFRIELGEIEAALRLYPNVQASAVAAWTDEASHTQLVAYVVAAEEPAPVPAELRAMLQTRLPDYMLPAIFVLLYALPLTPNGKLDRRALPPPQDLLTALDDAYIAPRTPTEELLAAIWMEVLGRTRIGVHDNFFDLGGHSLIVTQVMSRIRKALQVDLPVRDLFEAPTIAELAERIATAGATPGELSAPPIRPAPRDGALPLSFAQQRAWFLDQLDPDSTAYSIPATMQLSGPLNLAALRRSLRVIARRHEILRTTFVAADGRPEQRIAPTLRLIPPLLDLQGLTTTARTAMAQRLADEQSRRLFDLARGPLVQLALLRLNTEEHLLLLTLHHIIADGWSMRVLVEELAALYEAFLSGRPSLLPALPIQYADFAIWQRTWLRGAVLEAQLAYWRRSLAGAPALLELPTDRTRTPIQAFQGARLRLALPRRLSEQLKALGQHEGVTPFMTLLAAFKALLQRYTGQDDIVVGAPIANRNQVELERMLGFFANTLALRTNLAGNPTFRTVLARVREVALGAYAHQDLPFEKLVEELQPARNLSYTPLVQVLFALHNEQDTLAEHLRLPGPLVCRMRLPGENGTAKRDLSLHMIDGPDGIGGFLEYDSDLFDAPTISRMAGHLLTLIGGIVADPDRPIATLPLLTPAEQRLVRDWSGDTDAPTGESILRLFERQAARTPDAVAVCCELEQISYRALNQRAGQLARYLRTLGAGPEVFVGICMERGIALVLGILGVLKAGGVYVPLDPAYPAERIAFMLADAGMAILITHQRIDDLGDTPIVNRQSKIVNLDADWPRIASAPAHVRLPAVAPDSLAYVIYTSGSTGAPKGVMISNRSVAHNMQALQALLQVRANDRYLHTASFAFSSSVRQLFVPLAQGATVEIATAERVGDPLALFALIVARGVTLSDLVPSYWRACLSLLTGPDAPQMTRLRNRLRLLLSASEPLPPETPRDWRAEFGHTASLVNMFGQTETAGVITAHRIPAQADERASMPIGRPLAGRHVYLLDRQLQPVPIGVPGELFIGSAQMARGYLGRPDLTAERFVPNPFVTPEDERRRTNDERAARLVVLRPASFARLYKTGDLARWLPDGSIMFLGRVDQQVKLRGFRIEPGEIAAALAQHPAVRESSIMLHTDDLGERLVAYVVPASAERRTTNDVERDPAFGLRPSSLDHDLRAFLAERLPEYMLPAVFIFLAALPLTPNGKVDRRALPAPDRTRIDAEHTFVAPRTPAETALAAIWAAVLELERVGVHDNFFALGGDSIRSIQIVARAQAAGLRLSPRQLFLHQTIADLAAVVAPVVQPAPVAAEQPSRYELSPLQAGILFHTLYAPGSGVYCVQVAWELRGDLDASAFARAWQLMLDRHPALRTSFHWQESDVPQQVVQAEVALPLAQHDWRGLPAAEQRKRLLAYLTADRRQGFVLTEAPLLRLALLQTAADTYQFIFTHHHLVLDGWSLFVIFKEVFACYEAFRQSQTIQLAPSRPYSDYIGWLQRQPLAEAEAFWRQALAGISAPTPLGIDHNGAAAGAASYAERAIALAATTTSALNALARQHQLTLNTIVQGAWALLLSRYSGADDVIFGATVAGRPADLPGVEAMVGLFINTLPVRVALPRDATLIGWLQHLQLQQAELRQYEYSPLVQIQGWSELPRGLPLFESIVVFENYPIDRSLRTWSSDLTIQTGRTFHRTNYPLTVVALPGPELALRIAYESERFDAATITRALEHLRTALASIATRPAQAISELSLLTAAERQQLLVAWNDTRSDAPALPLHELFEAQAARTPAATALVFAATDLSYAQLNARANQLAHYLRARGVGPEARVAICMERSLDLAVALLGVLKAGAAYVALDPAYPQARLDFMLEDSQAAVLITATKDEGRRTEGEGADSPFGVRQALDLAADWPLIAHASTANPASGVRLDNLAYMIYTSGSTGVPKGVLVAHRAISNRLRWAQATYPLTEIDRVLQKYAFGFDAAICEFFWPLSAGARVVMARPGGQLDGAYLVELIATQRITIVDLVPSMLQMLLDQPGIAACNCLRHVFCGGEALTAELRVRFFAHLDGELSNHYGPTEAAIDVTHWRCRPDDPPRAAPIGRPIANTEIYLLDAQMQPTPIGVPGEVYIGGVALARGYHGRPDLTAERFVPNPLARTEDQGRRTKDETDAQPGVLGPSSCVRLYRTGDLARYRPDGSIAFLGRIDGQVKLRGFRIELGEVAAALERQSGLRESAVVIREDTPGDQRLVAYLVPRRSSEPVEWWPSVGEHQVYDELLYYAMTHDEQREQRYRAAISRAVAGKVAVDIGTGGDAILARYCVEAGAKRVYAIEILDDAYQQALVCVRDLGLEDRIILIHGDVFAVELPEPVDVCVSEIIGTISSSEGVVPLLNAARRFLKPAGMMIPRRSVTNIAAIQLPDELAGQPAFTSVPGHYVGKAFAQVGHPFDIRVCIRNFPPERRISDTAVFEDLDFTRPPATSAQELALTITKDARFDGFLLWVRLYVDDDATLDTLEQQTHWLPVYFPISYPGIAVRAGDRITAIASSRPGANNLNPDYHIAGRVIRAHGPAVAFDYDSLHERGFKQHPFYAALFANDGQPRSEPAALSIPQLRAQLAARLPEHMLPAAFVVLDALPRTPSGKLDQRALPAPDGQRPQLAAAYTPPRDAIERTITAIWQDVLKLDQVGVHDHFFDLGGHSLLMVQVHSRLRELLGRELALVDLFRHPTISALARHLSPDQTEPSAQPAQRGTESLAVQRDSADATDIAIIGMSGRFPRAGDLDAFWQNLRAGVEAVSFFSDQELAAAGVEATALHSNRYVRAKAFLEGIDLFDAAFFGYSPREAEAMDPQQRLFLECAWAALERAGYDAARYDGRIGVYAGASANSYLLFNLYANRDLIDAMGGFQLAIGNDKDYLTTRVSYKLNLTGPSIDVQTACSTSLVAVALACQSLLQRQCDMALAGGVSIAVPQKAGYWYQDGGVRSPDGHCRAFDAQGQGTVSGNGVGVIVLKRLADALADGDPIDAVIKGFAINNDGAGKVGFTAPSVDGQAAVIIEALAQARVDASSIGYVEAHGTATPLGDPIEIAALTQAFQGSATALGGCAIGSVKSNIGHLDAAAGIAGLIKAVLALKHQQIPPSLHFQSPNPQIDFANSPFYVNTMLRDWPSGPTPRRAGISSFGIGGTNAHVVLEEAPSIADAPARPWQLLVLAARTDSALETATANLAAHLREHPTANLADIAYTLQLGRRAFQQRRMLVCRDPADALAALADRDSQRVLSNHAERDDRPVVFLFPGQGAQYVGMARDLYRSEPAFRAVVDQCAELLKSHLGRDIRALLYPHDDERTTSDEGADSSVVRPSSEAAGALLDQTQYTQPALFVIAYALAQLWLSWGVRPRALLGHSIGEYVAACLAGVFSLADALALVALRGRMVQALPAGALLSVPLSEAALRPLLGSDMDVAAVNGPALCVVAGTPAALDALERRLADRGVVGRRLRAAHAFHSALLDPIIAPFAVQVGQISLHPPRIPYVSNLTGDWITAAQATDPHYWAQHLRHTVRFADGLATLLHDADPILLEVGPGRTLSTLARQQPAAAGSPVALTSLPHPRDAQPEEAFALGTLGKLWLAGAQVDWAGLHADERRRRLALPTYPFERQRYWIEPHGAPAHAAPPGDAQAAVSAPSLEQHPRPHVLNAYVAPTNEIESSIAAIWQELLGVAPIGINDDFFELGGHSLMATQIVARLQEVFPLELPLERLFEAATISQLAEVIEELLIAHIETLADDDVQRLTADPFSPR